MKLGTKIQLYITVMTVIVVILINTFVYFSYKNFSLNAEMGQLENRGINITQEIQNANANNIDSEAVLEAYLLSDGFITVVDEQNNPIVRIATETEYADMSQPYSTSQYTQSVEHAGEHFVMASMPIIWENGEVYSLQIYENVYFLYETFDILRWILIVSTIIILVVVFLMNRVITDNIIKPINTLIDKMKKTEDTSNYTMIETNENDTRELKELSESFNDMMEDLRRHDENQQAFIMNASHELKTPITVIGSYSRMLNRFGKTREDVLDESINAISSEAERMKYLTEQLLTFARVNREDESFNREPIRMYKLISDVARRLEAVYEREIEVVADDENVLGFVDKDTFDQLIKIFIDNAYKYSSKKISIDIRSKGNNVEITVQDRGLGIPEEDLDQIFTRFYRVDKVRDRKTGGSGLGLSIARELADMNNIEIRVDSEENVGTVFKLIIKKVNSNEEYE